MPFTLSHPAAVVVLRPLMGRFGVMSALAIGAMVPDVVYFVPVGIDRTSSHSLAGLLWFCLPAGVLCYLLFHWLLAPVMAAALPAAVSERLPAELRDGVLPRVTHVGVAMSVVAGAATHVAWDSLTHGAQWTRVLVPGLATPLTDIGGYPVLGYRVAQHGSTLVGGLVIAWCLLRWWRSLPPTRAPRRHISTALRWATRLAVIVLPLTVGLLSAADSYQPGAWLASLRYPLARLIMDGGGVFIAASLIMGTIIKWSFDN